MLAYAVTSARLTAIERFLADTSPRRRFRIARVPGSGRPHRDAKTRNLINVWTLHPSWRQALVGHRQRFRGSLRKVVLARNLDTGARTVIGPWRAWDEDDRFVGRASHPVPASIGVLE